MRLDKWLYYCRFYKTRSKAAAAVTGGHVRVNGERVAPGRSLRIGDKVELVRDRLPYAMEVVATPARRGPAKEARACYLENEETVRQREAQSDALKMDRFLMPRTEGRPDKRTRRLLRKR